MSGGTTNVVLRNLLSDMPYTVTVVPVYPEGEGLRQAEKGKTREWLWLRGAILALFFARFRFRTQPLVYANLRHLRSSMA